MAVRRTVGSRVDNLRKLSDSDLESTLDELEDFLVLVGGDEGDGESLGSEATGTSVIRTVSSVGGRKKERRGGGRSEERETRRERLTRRGEGRNRRLQGCRS